MFQPSVNMICEKKYNNVNNAKYGYILNTIANYFHVRRRGFVLLYVALFTFIKTANDDFKFSFKMF